VIKLSADSDLFFSRKPEEYVPPPLPLLSLRFDQGPMSVLERKIDAIPELYLASASEDG